MSDFEPASLLQAASNALIGSPLRRQVDALLARSQTPGEDLAALYDDVTALADELESGSKGPTRTQAADLCAEAAAELQCYAHFNGTLTADGLIECGADATMILAAARGGYTYVEEAARLVGVTKEEFVKLAEQCEIPATDNGHGSPHYSREHVHLLESEVRRRRRAAIKKSLGSANP